jgi:CRP/FNR family transcriptional regulator, cyclic AMP receptor protein
VIAESLPPPDLEARENELARVAFFEGLTREALSMLAAASTDEAHALGTRIFQHGDPGDKLYVILDGKIRISRQVAGIGEEAIAILERGDIFGEVALLDDAPRSADAIVHERCRLLVIAKNDFDDLLFFHKDLAYEVLWASVRMLAGRLRETNDKLSVLTAAQKF